MAHLLGIRIQRYKSLGDVTLGQHEHNPAVEPLPSLACLIGPNGSGKSTLLDAFGFLSDCLRENVEAACDKTHRGGFRKLRTQGEKAPMEFDLYYREDAKSRPITYSVAIDERDGTPIVAWETLQQRRKGQKHGRPYPFVKLNYGEGTAWSGESGPHAEGNESIPVHLDDPRRLGITTLGQLKEHPRILGLRAFIEGWYLSYFVPDLARTLPMAGAQKHLNRTGDNLANVLQYMERNKPEQLRAALAKIARRIPGISTIQSQVSPDGRLLIAFNERGYIDPFYASNMSDGTLKMFAYLLLLGDPEPAPFIGIEEPENGLYHKLLERLASEMKEHAGERQTNLLVTTHSPYFVDALAPEQVWLMQRGNDGRAVAKRAADFEHIRDLVNEGLPLGSLWYSNHFHERISV